MATLNRAGEAHANSLINAGHVDRDSSWSFSAEDGNKLLGPNGDDWENYGKFHLGVDSGETEKTKAYYKYPYGKDGKVYRSGVIAAKQRASQQNETEIADAADRLLSKIDRDKKDDGEKKDAKPSLIERIKAAILGTPVPKADAADGDGDNDSDTNDDDQCACCSMKDCPLCTSQEADGSCSCDAACEGCKGEDCEGLTADRQPVNEEAEMPELVADAVKLVEENEGLRARIAKFEAAEREQASRLAEARAAQVKATVTAFIKENESRFGKASAAVFGAIYAKSHSGEPIAPLELENLARALPVVGTAARVDVGGDVIDKKLDAVTAAAPVDPGREAVNRVKAQGITETDPRWQPAIAEAIVAIRKERGESNGQTQ